MSVQIVGDSPPKISAIGNLLKDKLQITTELLGNKCLCAHDINAVVVAADLRNVENISALKDMSAALSRISKRIFLIDQKSRLSIVQAYALGATSVLSNPVDAASLLNEILRAPANGGDLRTNSIPGAEKAAAAGAACLAAMFASILGGSPIDIEAARRVGRNISDSITEHGLTDWLTTVRRHHEGTFQHCLLVTGVAVDFGLCLGLAPADVERLCSAAMLHDIGKAMIPLAILDKPGRLEVCERSLVEAHPAIGYEALKNQRGVSLEVLDAVRHHHEYLDGSGYPDGIGASEIADLVRMLTISDIFAALIESRRYKPTMARERAYEILVGMNGKLEKPLVKAFGEVALTR
jgi:putative nucleotidyltransferase with HDIG domain